MALPKTAIPLDQYAPEEQSVPTAIPGKNPGLPKTAIPLNLVSPAASEHITKINKLRSIFPPTETEKGGTSDTDVALSTLEGTGRDLVSIPAAAANQYLSGFPKMLTTTMGYKYPAPTIGEGEKTDISGNAKKGNEDATDTSPAAGIASKLAGLYGAVNAPLNKMVFKKGMAEGALPTIGAGAMAGALTAGHDVSDTFNPMSILERAAVGGVTAGAVKGAGDIAGAVPEGLQSKAGELIDATMRRVGKYTKYNSSPSRGLLSENVASGGTPEEIQFKAMNRLEELGQEKERILSDPANASKTVDASDVMGNIDNALNKAGEFPERNAPLINGLKGVKSDLEAHIGDRDLSALSLRDADLLKQKIGSMSKFTDASSDAMSVNKAIDMTYGDLRSKLHEVSPELKDVNDRQSDLIPAVSALDNGDLLAGKTGKTTGLLKRGGVWTGLGAAGAVASGHPELAAHLAMGAAGEESAAAASANTGIRSKVAQGLYNAGEGLGNVRDVLTAKLEQLAGIKRPGPAAPDLPLPPAAPRPDFGPYGAGPANIQPGSKVPFTPPQFMPMAAEGVGPANIQPGSKVPFTPPQFMPMAAEGVGPANIQPGSKVPFTPPTTVPLAAEGPGDFAGGAGGGLNSPIQSAQELRMSKEPELGYKSAEPNEDPIRIKRQIDLLTSELKSAKDKGYKQDLQKQIENLKDKLA